MIKETFQVKPHEEGNALLEVLADRLRCSKKQAKTLLDGKQVMVNSQRIWMAKHRLSTRDRIEVIHSEAATGKKIEVLKKAGDILVINKPAGLVTNGSAKSLEVRLQREMQNPELCAVHRLDRETSGCVIFAKNAEAKASLIPIFKDQQVVKIYRAIVNGRVSDQLQTITRDIDGQSATTLVNVLDRTRDASYLELRIKTGRTHQIRKHLAAVRHPVLGDKGYAGSKGISEIMRTLPRQMLHAYKLILPLPGNEGQPLRVTAPVPADFKETLKALKLK
ncbi:MAG: RluA family pseudouridine synthase [Kiritimatiellales bacterium]|nr:RluA family pseudouridine synthase [Kiritimatiellota bacterium]MBL7012140.1 RluA family pseudouridine synthase [Kiritimatiellales bacterium]